MFRFLHPLSIRLLVASFSVIFLLTVAGCEPGRLRPVNVEIARHTLLRVLDHWKEGGSIDDLRDENPEIVAQEILWSSGNELISYELVGDGRAEDANWYCEVELTLKSPQSDATTTKTVTYVVGTHPVLTVFHAIL